MNITKHELCMQSQANADRIEPDKFNIVYADPPWRFRNWSMSEFAKRGEKWARRNGRSPYNVMNTEDICALPIGDIAARDSVLLMWATYPKLVDALQVIQAWGFEYKTVAFSWLKLNPSTVGYKMGLGYHSRGNVEPCLLATRGKGLQRVDNSVMQVIIEEGDVIIAPVGEHSRKPNEARLRIHRLYGDVPRVELFARQRVPGWSAWGNEVESDVVLLTGKSPVVAV
jgi:N6-adenosine-specific RNA methylase IME4